MSVQDRNYLHGDPQYPYLKDVFRQLWEQHVMWTRSFIISTAMNLPDLDLVTQRLLRNPKDFADQLQPFLGESAAREFQSLFEAHLQIAGQLVNAAKAGDNILVNETRKKWYQNADQIASFLAKVNPCWNEMEWRTMLYSHLELTEKEAVARLSGNYALDIVLYDFIESQALHMADMMSAGLNKSCIDF